jgi:hypothetical protein
MGPRHLALLAIALAALPLSLAVGFANLPTGPDREILFSPGLARNVPLYVVGDGIIDVTISSPGQGDPATLGTAQDDNILEYVHIDDPFAGSGQRELSLRFALPQQLKPGVHYVDVVAHEHSTGQQETVAALASVKLRFTVRVLTQEKLAEVVGFGIPAVAQGLEANATVAIASRTLQDIGEVQAIVRAYENGTIAAQGTTDAVALPSGKTVALFALLDTQGLAGGEYPANATVTYDGQQIWSQTIMLKVGTLHVAVPSHTESLLFNATNKFTFDVGNEWNRELRDVYATVRLGEQEKKTPSLNIPAFGRTAYDVYFDRDERISPGWYAVNVTVRFNDFDPQTQSYEGRVETFLVPVNVVQPAEERPAGTGAQALFLYGLLGVLVLLLLAVLFLLLRRRPAHAQGAPPPAQGGDRAP